MVLLIANEGSLGPEGLDHPLGAIGSVIASATSVVISSFCTGLMTARRRAWSCLCAPERTLICSSSAARRWNIVSTTANLGYAFLCVKQRKECA